MRSDLLRSVAGALRAAGLLLVLSTLLTLSAGGIARSEETAFACEAGERVLVHHR